MSVIEIIAYSVALSLVLTQVVQIGRKLKFKPFNCEICLSGWVAAIYGLIAGYFFELPGIMALAMLATLITTHLINKL